MDIIMRDGILVFVMILASAMFAGTETAFTSLSAFQVEELKVRGWSGKRAYALAQRPDILLSTILAGNTLVNIGVSAVVTQMTIELWGSTYIGIATAILTFAILVFGEITPKQIAILHNFPIAATMGPVIWILSVLLYPVIISIGALSRFIASIGQKGEGREVISMANIHHFMDQAKGLGVIDSQESKFIKVALRFDETSVRGVLTHRREVFMLQSETSIEEAFESVRPVGFSRIPVYGADEEEIVGIVLFRDLIEHYFSGNKKAPISTITIDPLIVHENTPISELSNKFGRFGVNMAIVQDEFGGFAGVVTHEDIAEEFFGELYDENESGPKARIVSKNTNSYSVAGDITLAEFSEHFGLDLEEEKHVHTLGGYVQHHLGEVPKAGDKLERAEGIYVVRRMRGYRIERLLFTKHKTKED